jgi:hypothetical protein
MATSAAILEFLDEVRIDTAFEQPGARVRASLAAADDRVAARRLTNVGQLVDRDTSDVGVDGERRRVCRRDRWFEIASEQL